MNTSTVTLKDFYISSDHDFRGQHGKPRNNNAIEKLHKIECVEGKGIIGDRYFKQEEEASKRQITFFDLAIFQELKKNYPDSNFDSSVFRRNIVIEGIDLNSLINHFFTIANVQFYGVEECSPCYWMDQAVGPGAEDLMQGKGGLRCKIVTGGKLTTGIAELTQIDSNESYPLKVYAFSSSAKELGFKETTIMAKPNLSPIEVLSQIETFTVDQSQKYRIAINESFSSWTDQIGHVKEIAIIPPVSGG